MMIVQRLRLLCILWRLDKLQRRCLFPQTSGNVSVRVGHGFLISTTAIRLDRIGWRGLVWCPFAGEIPCRASSEWRLHREIYCRREDAKAIVHYHGPHTVALSCRRQAIEPLHYMVALTGANRIDCAPYRLFGSPALSQVTVQTLGEKARACLLANHGGVTLGSSLEQALSLALEVEALAQQLLLAGPKACMLSAKQMDDVQARFKIYR